MAAVRQRGGSRALRGARVFGEHELVRLVERAPDAIVRYSVRPPGFQYVSRAITNITGYSPEELYGNPLSVLAIVHRDDRAMMHELLVSGNGNAPLVFRWVRKDRTLAWIEQRSIAIFDPAHRLVAIEAIAREIADPTTGSRPHVRVLGDVRIDLDAGQVLVDGRRVRVTPSEFRILLLLTEQPGRTVSRASMMEAMWNSSHIGSGRACEVHISKLRAKIEADAHHPVHIQTVRGAGYRFIPSG